jgi:hypothetical protein
MKLGRKPRAFDQRIPKLHNLQRDTTIPMPAHVDYTNGMSKDLGAMLNDTLGDCTCAAVGHAIQVWSFNIGGMKTPSDQDIEALYEKAGGYIPGNPDTDNGCIEQDVLTDWLNGPVDGNELSAFVEVDPANFSDVKRTIWDCGLIYIGFNVPAYLMNSLTSPGSTWDVNNLADNTIVGGHCVIVAGYDSSGNMKLISWGAEYTMTAAFWSAYVDECYGLVNKDWITVTKKTPAGLTLEQLEALMNSMKFTPAPISPLRRHRHHRRMKRRNAIPK